MKKSADKHSVIRNFVGDISPEQLVHVESFTGINIGIFIPSTGHCFYAISEDHTHPAFSFYYSYDKKISMKVNGKTVHSRPGYISALPDGIKHHEIPTEKFTRYIAILINPEFFYRHASFYKKKITPELIQYIHLPEMLLPAVRQFMIETSLNNEGSPEVIASLEVQIVHHLLRSIFSIRQDSGIITERADIDYVVEYINDNYSEQITLEDIAGKIALSKSHFSRVFKRETGYTMQNYIVKVRIDRAKMLLMRSNTKITEIAHECGFSSSAHFTSAFVKHVGVQPSVFRKDITL